MAVVNVLPTSAVSGTTVVKFSFLSWLESQEQDRADKYAMYRNYYEGEQATQLTARLRKFLELGNKAPEFNLNVCPIVVDELADKLTVSGFDCGTDKALSEAVKQWWEASRMDATQGVVHRGAVRDGDTYLMVEWNDEAGRPVFTQENAFNGTEGVHLVYSNERRTNPLVAIKTWTITSGPETATKRTNLYYPDRIEKYSDYGSGGRWQEYRDEADPRWPIPWLDKDRKPLGVPVIHWRNKDLGYSYGLSEEDDVIPMQNATNKTVIDLLAAADSTAFGIPYMTGGKPTLDGFNAGSWVYSENPDAKLGILSPADLTGLIALHDAFIADVAKITRTPLSAFQVTGAVAAEGTLKEQRAGLNAKIGDRQVGMGNSWEDALYLAVRLHNTFGNGGLNADQHISTVWKDPEAPSAAELAEQVNAANTAGAMSIETKVRTLHPEWEQKAIDAEVALIRAEQMVPDVGPLP